MSLLQALRNQSAKISADLENSKLFTHMGDRGRFREAIIRDFLRPFLPECYGLSVGEIFAGDGARSAQVDIVLYDALFSTVLFRNGPEQLFPAESVYGSIEVKSNLTTEELDKACGNIASVKSLPRAASDMMDVLPSVRLGVGGGLTFDATQMNPYLGIVFGYQGINPQAVVMDLTRRMAEAPQTKQFLPDFIFVAHPGYIITRIVEQNGRQHPVVGIAHDFQRYMWTSTGSDTLPLFYFTVNTCLSHMRLRAPSFNEMWDRLFRELVFKQVPSTIPSQTPPIMPA
jgi:hypothetical protein